MKEIINENERIDDLQRNGFKIIQNKELFCFGTDAVLLSHFAKIKKGDRVYDLGAGNGVIGLLLCSMYEDISVFGLEIQEKSAELARRNIELNKVGERMSVTLGDINRVNEYFPCGEAEVVITNPPYMKAGLRCGGAEKDIARHETLVDLRGVLKAAAYLLKFGGRFYMVHKAERLCGIFEAMKEFKIEPKRIRMVQAMADKEPSMVLVEGAKGGKPGLRVMPAFVIYDKEGKATEEYNRIYYG